MAVRIVTDSAADLTDAESAALGVTVVPLSIRFGDDEYVDRRDLTPGEFYAKLHSASVLPETAAPSPGAFEVAFREAVEGGADAVVCINISSLLSATMASAQNAARAVDGDIRIVDSRSITWGLGSQVQAAAEAAEAGASADDVVTLVEGMKPRTRVYGALDTLDNL
jgi:DegV family protein with EDD domain